MTQALLIKRVISTGLLVYCSDRTRLLRKHLYLKQTSGYYKKIFPVFKTVQRRFKAFGMIQITFFLFSGTSRLPPSFATYNYMDYWHPFHSTALSYVSIKPRTVWRLHLRPSLLDDLTPSGTEPLAVWRNPAGLLVPQLDSLTTQPGGGDLCKIAIIPR